MPLRYDAACPVMRKAEPEKGLALPAVVLREESRPVGSGEDVFPEKKVAAECR
jgi:hypothetical protein